MTDDSSGRFLSFSFSLFCVRPSFPSCFVAVAVETVINILPAVPCPPRPASTRLWRLPCRNARVPFPSWVSSSHLTWIPLFNPYSQPIPSYSHSGRYTPRRPSPRGYCHKSPMLISQIPRLGTLRCQFSAHPTVSPRPNLIFISPTPPFLALPLSHAHLTLNKPASRRFSVLHIRQSAFVSQTLNSIVCKATFI